MKTLFLMRHAKSDWGDPSIDDSDRSLNKRGRDSAVRMARYLRDHELRPELVLCSSARRAVETLEPLAADMAAEVRLEPDLYLAGADALADRIRIVPAPVSSIMLIGHNPGMHELALRYASAGEQLLDLEEKFPTAALAVIAFEQEDWDLQPDGTLQMFVRPRDLD